MTPCTRPRSSPVHFARSGVVLLAFVAACADVAKAPPPEPAEDWTRDLLRTELELDLTTRTGRATITMADGGASTGASLEIGDLEIAGVSTPDGDALEFIAEAGVLHVGVPADGDDATIVVDYTFAVHAEFDGWDPGSGLTFLWPYFCGNLFPCKPDPSEGQAFTLRVTGVPAGQTAVYPTEITTDAPSYMPAIAVGAFTELRLGATAAGTEVMVWHLPGEADAAAAGTANLVDVFSFYETTYGPYPYGDRVGSVSAGWGPGAYGGMEHHPYWHVATDALASEEVHAHEAAHGWFGNGVRIGCWEDFVLSEGTASYIAARALESQGVDTWAEYDCRLKEVCESDGNAVALPGTCAAIDIFNDPLWSDVPYMKGAYFFRAVADVIGAGEVDAVLADFFDRHVGQMAQMEDLVADLAARVPAQAQAVEAIAAEWLGAQACPLDTASLCPG